MNEFAQKQNKDARRKKREAERQIAKAKALQAGAERDLRVATTLLQHFPARRGRPPKDTA